MKGTYEITCDTVTFEVTVDIPQILTERERKRWFINAVRREQNARKLWPSKANPWQASLRYLGDGPDPVWGTVGLTIGGTR